jgi:7-cyano-7-deazaguanine reductase
MEEFTMDKVNLDPKLVESIKNLRLSYSISDPQPSLLIPIPNQTPEVDYNVHIEAPEFTSLCPLNFSQPDFATLVIDYLPKDRLVELKSLKFYLTSYRMCPVFHEQVPTRVLKDLVELLDPKVMTVTGIFTTRGGIDVTVTAGYPSPEDLQK